MYEKKINLFNSIDREILSKTFKYNACFFIMLLILFFVLLFFKINCIYQNNISFINEKSAIIIVEKEYLDSVKSHNKIILNEISYDYSIDKIEEIEKEYLIGINFNNELKINTSVYKLYLGKESLLKYIIKMIKGD